jgi:hypothetical protein
MDPTNNKVFAFLLMIEDEILTSDPPGHLRTGLELCSNECCVTYFRLFRVGNSIRKYFLAAIIVYVILSKAGRKCTASLLLCVEVNLLIAKDHADSRLPRSLSIVSTVGFVFTSFVQVLSFVLIYCFHSLCIRFDVDLVVSMECSCFVQDQMDLLEADTVPKKQRKTSLSPNACHVSRDTLTCRYVQ